MHLANHLFRTVAQLPRGLEGILKEIWVLLQEPLLFAYWDTVSAFYRLYNCSVGWFLKLYF
jgi:hypothetical protein